MELIVVMAIVAILAVLAAPSFRDTIDRNRRQTALESVVGMLGKARAEAAANSAATVACASSNGTACSGTNNWEAGYLIFLDNGASGGTAGNSDRESNEPILRIGSEFPTGITVRAVTFSDTSEVVFTADGIAAQRGTFQICDSSGTSSAKAVILNRSGQARLATDENNDGIVNTDGGAASNVSCP
jgi:type IV fimbrial biogenesis protein FimT